MISPMSTAVRSTHRPAVVASALPGDRVRDVIVVLVYAAAVGLSAQIMLPLQFTPVPITGQTFAVLAGAMVVGFGRATAGTALYLVLGLAGIPWLAAGHGGLSVFSLPSFGYVVGFVAAAALSGALADRGWARHPLAVLAAMVAGNCCIYAVGAGWLMVALHTTPDRALLLGVLPFLGGDMFKLAFAMVALPFATRLVVDRR
jgi:biotin transport system substrate-specific component